MVPETHFWGGDTIIDLKNGLRVTLKIAVSATSGFALVVLVGLFSELYGFDNIDDEVLDTALIFAPIFGAYIGILWSVGNRAVRHWLIWAPLAGLVAGILFGNMRYPRTDNYTLPQSQKSLSLDDTLTDEDWEKIDALIEQSRLNRFNVEKFMQVLARHDPNDPDKIQKTLTTLSGVRREAIIMMGVGMGLIGLFVGVVGALHAVGAFRRKRRSNQSSSS